MLTPPFKYILLVAAAVIVAGPCFSEDQTEPGKVDVRTDVCLTRSHVDPKSEASLIAAVWGSDVIVASCAARKLGQHERSPASDQALLHATQSADDVLALYAAISLADHHNFEWVDELSRRLPDVKNPLNQIHIAGLLATAGHYEGWEVIRSTIITKQIYNDYVDVALYQVPKFAGMKDPDGSPVNLAEELDRMNTIAPPDVKPAIMMAMARVSAPSPKQPRPTVENEE